MPVLQDLPTETLIPIQEFSLEEFGLSRAAAEWMERENVIVVDGETTGLSPNKNGLSEWCMMRVRNGRIQAFHSYILPIRADGSLYEVSPEALNVTGFTFQPMQKNVHSPQTGLNMLVDSKPVRAHPFHEIASEADAFLKSPNGPAKLAGHNVMFDMDFLKAQFQDTNRFRARHWLKAFFLPQQTFDFHSAYCSMFNYARRWPGPAKLDHAASRQINGEFKGRGLHSALEDTGLTLAVLGAQFDHQALETVGDVLHKLRGMKVEGFPDAGTVTIKLDGRRENGAYHLTSDADILRKHLAQIGLIDKVQKGKPKQLPPTQSRFNGPFTLDYPPEDSNDGRYTINLKDLSPAMGGIEALNQMVRHGHIKEVDFGSYPNGQSSRNYCRLHFANGKTLDIDPWNLTRNMPFAAGYDDTPRTDLATQNTEELYNRFYLITELQNTLKGVRKIEVKPDGIEVSTWSRHAAEALQKMGISLDKDIRRVRNSYELTLDRGKLLTHEAEQSKTWAQLKHITKLANIPGVTDVSLTPDRKHILLDGSETFLKACKGLQAGEAVELPDGRRCLQLSFNDLGRYDASGTTKLVYRIADIGWGLKRLTDALQPTAKTEPSAVTEDWLHVKKKSDGRLMLDIRLPDGAREGSLWLDMMQDLTQAGYFQREHWGFTRDGDDGARSLIVDLDQALKRNTYETLVSMLTSGREQLQGKSAVRA